MYPLRGILALIERPLLLKSSLSPPLERATNIAGLTASGYDQAMNNLLLLVASAVAGIFLMQSLRKHQELARQAASARLDAMRFHRHMERLEMVLKQAEPELFAQVKARSDMEWQQAVNNLAEGELPTLYPLEKMFTPISSRASADRH